VACLATQSGACRGNFACFGHSFPEHQPDADRLARAWIFWSTTLISVRTVSYISPSVPVPFNNSTLDIVTAPACSTRSQLLAPFFCLVFLVHLVFSRRIQANLDNFSSSAARSPCFSQAAHPKSSLTMSQELSYSDVSSHSTKKDLYVVIHDKVYNASSFVDEHP
jgi:hypothetical protein